MNDSSSCPINGPKDETRDVMDFRIHQMVNNEEQNSRVGKARKIQQSFGTRTPGLWSAHP
jgi:hypothetical protein